MPDIGKFATKKKASEGVKMIVKHPETGEPLLDETTKQPLTITLIGADADEYKKIQHAYANKRLKQAGKAGKLTLTAEGLEAEAFDLLVKCTKGWEGICLGSDDKGNPIPLSFSEENARKLYETIPFVKDQVADFVQDRANFLGN